VKKTGFYPFFVQYQLCDEITTPFPPRGVCAGFHALKFVSRTYSRGYNFVTPLYTPEGGKKIFLNPVIIC
jgi:hypothetical protein